MPSHYNPFSSKRYKRYATLHGSPLELRDNPAMQPGIYVRRYAAGNIIYGFCEVKGVFAETAAHAGAIEHFAPPGFIGTGSTFV
jgi:hypothetical protein